MRHEIPRRAGISLRETLTESTFFGCSDIRVQSCCGTWDRCQEGDVYVAFDTPDGDGHHYVEDAVQRGASAIVSERLIPASVPVCVVDDSRSAFGVICQSLCGNPSQQLQTVGVTGTNGKTVTSHLVQHVLQAAGNECDVLSTIERRDGWESSPILFPNSQPPQMASFLANALSSGCSHAVVELSSRSLAQRLCSGIEFDATILTNLRHDHLDFHGSISNYRKAKSRVFQQLKPEGFAILNADDKWSETLLDHIDHPALTFGIQERAEIMAHVIERLPSEQTFLLKAGNESIPVRTQMIGDHHVYNCLAAAAYGLVLGIDLSTIARGLENASHLPGRLERLECGQPYNVFVDYARTPDQLASGLKTLREVTRGRILCVYGNGGNRCSEVRPRLGRTVERLADLGVITSDEPSCGETLQVAHDILDGYHRPSRDHVLPNRTSAIHWALAQAEPGDTVLVAGKGCETSQLVENKLVFQDDRETCKDYLYGRVDRSHGEGDSEPVIFDIRDYRKI